MNCEREIEVVAALLDGRWPEGCEASLREHVDACASCAEVAVVAGALRAEHLAAVQEAVPPPSGAVWWRAQRRAKQEALETASRAITTVQAASVSIAAVIALTIAGFTRETWTGWIARISDGFYFGAYQLTPAASTLMLAGAASMLLLAPLAIWFAIARD